jgi:hypothetical protein
VRWWVVVDSEALGQWNSEVTGQCATGSCPQLGQ